MSPLGIGNDIGGSLRNPAHCCGVASIKPTTGRVPHARALPPEDGTLADQLMAVQGVMARRVADVRLGLEVVAGQHPRDPGSLPVRSSPATAARPSGWPWWPSRPAEAPSRRSRSSCGELGRSSPSEATRWSRRRRPRTSSRSISGDAGSAASSGAAAAPAPGHGPDALRFVDLVDATVPEIDIAGHVGTLIERRAIARAWSAFLHQHALVLSPVWTRPAFVHGFDIEGEEQALATLELIRPVLPANLLGLPAAAVPAGHAAGLPAAVQVLGGPFRELACLEAARAIEDAVGVRTPIDPRL